MPQVAFSELPDDARLWIFATERSLPEDTAASVLEKVDGFLEGWNAHGAPLSAGRAWRDDRFLLVAVDERTAPPSGCSIDALHRILKELEGLLGVGLTDHGAVFHRTAEGAIVRSDRPTFAVLAREGAVDLDTPVFDTTLTRKGQLAERFEVPAGAAWHRRAFWRSEATPPSR